MRSYQSEIFIIGVNPYVPVPENILGFIFKKSGKLKGGMPVEGTIDGHPFQQTLVKYTGMWRLYLNMPMRKAAQKDVGDRVTIELWYDDKPREVPMPDLLAKALRKNKIASQAFDQLSPSRQKEIKKYINSLKSKESINRNVEKVISHLEGNGRFAGRDL